MFPKNLLIIDVETSGVTDDASIIQLGAVIFKKEGELSNDTFNRYIKPYNKEWSYEAQEIHGLTKEFLNKKGTNINIVLKEFQDWCSRLGMYNLKKHYWIAQWGSGFDTRMLSNAYKYIKKDYPFYYRAIDIASIVRFNLANKGLLENKCGEKACAIALNLELEKSKLHDGLYDAYLSGRMLEKIIKENRNEKM